MLKQNRVYRFDPPIEAAGACGEGEKEHIYPRMRFPIGLCVENLGHTYKFISQVGGHRYTFFAHPEKNGHHITEIGEPINE